MFANSERKLVRTWIITIIFWTTPFHILACGNNVPDSLPILHFVLMGFQIVLGKST